MQMDKKLAVKILEFLERVPLQGSEVTSFVAVRNWIVDAIEPKLGGPSDSFVALPATPGPAPSFTPPSKDAPPPA